MGEPIERDGNVDFSGGMDTSRQPYLLGRNQYARACNFIIPRHTNRIRTRFGIHHQKLIGDVNDLNIYKDCQNIQAEGFYNTGKETVLLRVVDGFVIEFRLYVKGCFKIKVLNRGDKNNPDRAKAWITRIPQGAIIQDGESLPFIVTNHSIRRSVPKDGEIGVGRMGVFTQNRYFYVTQKENFIQASDFTKPTSIKNSDNTNIHGFLLPESHDVITAIGSQKATLNYVDGGVLSFSSVSNTYSVDVRGDRQDWEIVNTNVGKVQEVIPGVGAVSSYSYEAFNTNLWFRTIDFGLMSLNRSQFQFVNDDDYSSQSLEANYWFENDSEILLDKCYTKQYRNRLLTTVGPELNKHGYTFWNGLISMNPDPVYTDQKLPRRFESLITGVRPWCITSVKGYGRSDLFIDSYDKDGSTRLYKIEPDFNYDLNHKGQKIEIESWIETRGYFHGDVTQLKIPTKRYYSIYDLSRNVTVKTFSRAEEEGPWQEFHNTEHKIKNCCLIKQVDDSNKFKPISLKKQSRVRVNLPKENSDSCKNPSFKGQRKYYSRQDRLHFKGFLSLGAWLREANTADENNNAICGEEKTEKEFSYLEEKDYTYNIAES